MIWSRGRVGGLRAAEVACLLNRNCLSCLHLHRQSCEVQRSQWWLVYVEMVLAGDLLAI